MKQLDSPLAAAAGSRGRARQLSSLEFYRLCQAIVVATVIVKASLRDALQYLPPLNRNRRTVGDERGARWLI